VTYLADEQKSLRNQVTSDVFVHDVGYCTACRKDLQLKNHQNII